MKTTIKITCQATYIILFAVFLVSCSNQKKPEGQIVEKADTQRENEDSVKLTLAQYKSVGITLGSPEMKALSGVLKVNGFIDVPPQDLVSITTQMGGIVKSTPLLPGSVVKKGQVIAVLQNQEYVQLQQDYLESKSQLELTDAEYKRQLVLAQQNVNAQKTVQQAKAQYQNALAKESALKQRLALININAANLSAGNIRSQVNIYAPISGYVTKVNVNAGKFVNPNDAMFEIVNSSNLHVELKVFEKDAASIKAGQQVRFTLTNDSTEQHSIIELVGREINPDKTVTVHTIAKGSKSFIPGTYLNAFIETGKNQVLALPQSAVVDFEGKKYIFVESGKGTNEEFNFKILEVTTGVVEGGFVEVQIPEKMNINGRVVIKGTYDLLSKMKNSEED